MALFIELPLLLLLSCVVRSSEGATKTWTRDIKFERKENWMNSTLPCPNQRILLTKSPYVYVTSKISAVEIVLPRNGGIILGARAVISAPGNARLRESYCDRKDVSFQPNEDINWFNADNWQTFPDSLSIHIGVNSTDRALIPDSERVPCSYDDVIFEDTCFRVTTENRTVTVASVQIFGRTYDEDALRTLMHSEAGRIMFDGFVKTGHPHCQDPTGCACGNDAHDRMEVICKLSERICPPFACLDPVTLNGSCCTTCASYLHLEYSQGFKLSALQNYLRTSASDPYFTDKVQTYLHKMHDSRIQIIIIDASPQKGYAHKLSQKLYSSLQGNMKDALRIKSVILKSSHQWPQHLINDQADKSSDVGVIVGSVLTIVGIIALTIFLITRYQKQLFTQNLGSTFAKFRRGGDIELELGTTPHDALVPSQLSSFTNPLSHPFKDQEKWETDEREESSTSGFENPVFTP